MLENDFSDSEGRRSAQRSFNYLNRAQKAQQRGEFPLATSLYLAAFDCALIEGIEEEEAFIEGLRQAWDIAATGGQRTLAEYIFGRLEPYLPHEEAQRYVMRLQDLALDRLEEFGVSREELEDMLAAIPADLADMGLDGLSALFDDYFDDDFDEDFDEDFEDDDFAEGFDALRAIDESNERGGAMPEHVERIPRIFGHKGSAHVSSHASGALGEAGSAGNSAVCAKGGCGKDAPKDVHRENACEQGVCSADAREEDPRAALLSLLQGEDDRASARGNASDGRTSSGRSTVAMEKGTSRDAARKNPAEQSDAQAAAQLPDVLPFLSQVFQGAHGAIAAFGFPSAPGQQRNAQRSGRLTYEDMAGFERTVDQMHSLGIGFTVNTELRDFVTMLNEKHGLVGAPVADSLIFRAPAREDAGHFMDATLGELGVPGVRVHVDENAHGDLVLCVLAQTNSGLRFNTAKGVIEGSGALLLEDIDLWSHLLPFDDECHECSSPRMQFSSKGSREALRLIQAAVDNPDVYVLASCSTEGSVEGAFLDMLEPFELIDIDNPTEYERASLWNDLMNQHPSMKGADIDLLVSNSKGLPRFDIYMAAREAIEASYKASLASREYKPVSTVELCEKLAAYQPLESAEYKFLEEQVINDFRQDLDQLDALLGFEDASNVAALLGEAAGVAGSEGAAGSGDTSGVVDVSDVSSVSGASAKSARVASRASASEAASLSETDDKACTDEAKPADNLGSAESSAE